MAGRWGRGAATAGVAIAAAAALAACHPAKLGEGRNGGDHALTVADRLDCPDEQGSLRRTIQAPDGKSCTYKGDDGETVTLSYLALDGKSPEAALAPTEASFHALLPGRGETVTSDSERSVTTNLGNGVKFTTSVKTGHDDGDAGAETADADSADSDDGDRGGRHKDDHVAINLPGLHIDADGDKASVRAFGQNVVADGKGATVTGGAGGVKTSVKADDDGAEIRAGFVGKQAVDLTYVLASDASGPSGEHAAAYVARGPVGGPLVLASGTLKEGDRHVDKDRFDDLRDLVNRNVKRVGR